MIYKNFRNTFSTVFAFSLFAALLSAGLMMNSDVAAVKTVDNSADSVKRDEKAIEYFKQNGSYDSLAEAVTTARYKIEQNGETLNATNPANQMRAQFTESGDLQLFGTEQNSDWQTIWKLKSIGRGENQTTVGGGSWQVNETRAELRRAEISLTEYFENRPDGLEQGWIVEAKPSGEENLLLILQTSGELTAKASADGQKIILSDERGAEVLNYEKLKVWDANQNYLTAQMTTNETGEIRLEVEDASAVYPLTIDPTFVQRGLLKASDLADGDRFGASVAISGNTAVIGAPEDFVLNNPNQGSAYIFVLNGINWSQQAKLTANDGAENDYFGRSVSISGDTIVVGASGDDAGKGSVYIFVRNNTNWQPQEKLTANDGVAGDIFGWSISISGETVVVGANGDNIGANTNQGSVYAYVRSGGVWSFQQKLSAVSGTANAQFGKSLSLTGGTVIIGAFTETVGGDAGQGAAYVFTRSGSTWTQQTRLTASDGTSNDNFGTSVDLSLTVSGTVAVVGAENDNIAGNTAQGSAYVFNRPLAGFWTQTQKLTNTNGFPDDRFGSSVAITPNTAGNIFIGEEGANQAFVFKRVNSVWSEQQRIRRSLGFAHNFGCSIAVSGDTVIVGAENDRVIGFGSPGTAYIFKFGGSPFDFDGDDKTDIGIFRPSNGQWWINRSSTGQTFATQFGQTSDRITPGDFTGDGKADVAFWRTSNGLWFVLRSEDSTYFSFPFGANGDVPAPADYDGDGKFDAAVFRPSSLTWFILKSSGGTTIQQFGAAGDLPVTADYDGDGKSDIAIFRPNGANGAEWWIQQSSNNTVFATQFGTSSDKAVQGDFTGDGKVDIAFWRPSNGNWFVLRSEDLSFFSFPFGANGDTPVAGDYDGDGKFDAGVFRPSNQTWFIQRSTAGTLITSFGIAGDKPVPSAFVP